MARAFISLASFTAAAAAGAALIRARRADETPAQKELPDPVDDPLRALDAARARLRAQVPPRPAVPDAA
jgi:hypothetical protein